jgi:hypothetical protein
MSVIEDVRAERRLSEELMLFVGEYVAVRNHQVVDHDADLDVLLARTDGQELDGVFPVLPEETSACFFL